MSKKYRATVKYTHEYEFEIEAPNKNIAAIEAVIKFFSSDRKTYHTSECVSRDVAITELDEYGEPKEQTTKSRSDDEDELSDGLSSYNDDPRAS